jgi:hypothetical protein
MLMDANTNSRDLTVCVNVMHFLKGNSKINFLSLSSGHLTPTDETVRRLVTLGANIRIFMHYR